MYGIRCFLCSQIASLMQYSSVGAHLATRCLSQCLGWQELAALKHHATCFQALLGCSLCLPTLPFRPWRGITICNEKARRIVILNTAPPDFAGEPTSPKHINKKISQIARFFCDSEAIRTLDPRLRRALLYPAELRNRPLCVKTLRLSVFVCKDSAFLLLCQRFFGFFHF